MTLTGFQLRNRQAVGWVIAAAFVVGFFIPAVGQWTGPILACWFVGTQRPWRDTRGLCAAATTVD